MTTFTMKDGAQIQADRLLSWRPANTPASSR